MNLRSTDGGARIRSTLALLAVASTVLLLSPVAQAQHMRGSGGSQWGAHMAGASHFNHNGIAPRGFHHHRAFSRFVVIGSVGFFGYPYLYPYDAYPVYYDYSAGPTWYYCDAAGAYYPSVTTCPGGWRVVPATPAPAYPLPPQ